MSEEQHEQREEGLTQEELDELEAEVLPVREQMSVIQPISPLGGGHTVPVEPPPTE
jgi:hypothetical protein